MTEIATNDGGKSSSVPSDLDRGTKLLITGAIYYCTFALGVAGNMVGPAALDFSKTFGTDIEGISTVFSIGTGFYLLGAITGGFVYNFIHRQALMVILLGAVTTCVFLFPQLTSLTPFLVMSAVHDFSIGVFDVGQVPWIMDTWKTEAAPFVLAQNFFYSIGMIVPALLLAPFLTDEVKDEGQTTTEKSVLTSDLFFRLNQTEVSLFDASSTEASTPFKSKLSLPFSIAGCVAALGIIVQALLYFKLRCTNHEISEDTCPSPSQQTVGQSSAPPLNQAKSKGQRILLLALSCLIFGSFLGKEATALEFLMPFAVFSQVRLTEAQGARVLSGLIIAFNVARLAGIFIVLRFPPQFLLFGSFVFFITGNLVLLLLGQSQETWLWVGAVLLGIGIATEYSAYYAYLGEHLYITETIAAVFTVTGESMAAVYPLVIGPYIEEAPSFFIYVNFVSVALGIGLFATVFWITRIRGRNPRNQIEST